MPAKKDNKISGLSRGEKARRQIVQHAIRLIAREGFEQTSFQKIADKCGVSQSAVLHHFRNRDELLMAVIDAILESNHEIVAGLLTPHDSGQDRLMKYFRGNVKWALEQRDQAQILLLLYYLSCVDKRFTEIYAKLLQGGRNRILEPLLAGVREGQFELSRSPELTAEILHDGAVGVIVAIVADAKRAPALEKLERKWDELVKALTR